MIGDLAATVSELGQPRRSRDVPARERHGYQRTDDGVVHAPDGNQGGWPVTSLRADEP